MESQTLEADPGICPSAYHGLRDLLKKYMKLLTVMFGDQCHHLQEIKGIYQAIGAMISTYETMSPELVVAIVWQIFIDARSFFLHLVQVKQNRDCHWWECGLPILPSR